MQEITSSQIVLLVLAHFLYYAYNMGINKILQAGQMYNSPSVKIDNLRTKYKVNIKTYRKNNVHPAFTFLNTIYLNEKYINNERPLMFAFFHELYHYNHNHTKIMLVIRLLITLTPILLFFFTWQITLTVWYLWGCVMVLLTKRFEKKANEYARSKTKKR